MAKARLAAGIGIAVVLAVGVALLIRDGSSSSDDTHSSSPGRPAPRGPVATSLDGLTSFADSVGHPVYWAGQRPGGYELTVDASAGIFIRYLEGRVPVGSRRRTSLTVATYPYPDAYRTLRAASGQSGQGFTHTPDGGLIDTDTRSPDNVHIAYRGRDIQIEVYDPRPGRALDLARAGAIVPLQ